MMQTLMYFKRHGDLTKFLKYIFLFFFFFVNQRCYFSVKDFFPS